MKSFVIILAVLFLHSFIALGSENQAIQDTTYIFLKDYGLHKTKKKDATKFINRLLDDPVLKSDNPKILVFTPGIYNFYPEDARKKTYYESNTTDVNPKVCAFLFENINNLTIDGRGSRLIFHEQMQPFTFDNCSNIVLKNISIDWEYPLIAQAEVLKTHKSYIDLAIDFKETPFRVQDDKLWFDVNRDHRNPWKSTLEFDREGRFIVPQTGDNGCLGAGWENYRAVATMPGIVRLYNNFQRLPEKGNILILRHATRAHAGLFIFESKNVSIKNLNLYHATGLGILAQFSEDLTFDRYRAIPNPAKNRYFGGGDDGIQISNCKGKVSIKNCEFKGLMDDPVNVHGTSVQVKEIISSYQIKCKFMHDQSIGLNWGHTGDRVSFIDHSNMSSLGTGEIKNSEIIDHENFIVAFTEKIPDDLDVGDALENLSWTPALSVANNHFGNCRARGLLVSTPGEVVIENNVFESSGSAILIAGDANSWFESGAVNNVIIRNNTFNELCNSSPYQFCEGIISIYPIIPNLDVDTPAFHKNIRIESNQFHPFDYPILFARSVENLSFTNNTITRSFNFEPYHSRQYNFTFEYCKNVVFEENLFPEDLLGKNILLRNTPYSELKTDAQDFFQIENY